MNEPSMDHQVVTEPTETQTWGFMRVIGILWFVANVVSVVTLNHLANKRRRRILRREASSQVEDQSIVIILEEGCPGIDRDYAIDPEETSGQTHDSSATSDKNDVQSDSTVEPLGGESPQQESKAEEQSNPSPFSGEVYWSELKGRYLEAPVDDDVKETNHDVLREWSDSGTEQSVKHEAKQDAGQPLRETANGTSRGNEGPESNDTKPTEEIDLESVEVFLTRKTMRSPPSRQNKPVRMHEGKGHDITMSELYFIE